MFSSTGLSPSTDRPSQATSTNTTVYHCSPRPADLRRNAPQHRTHNPRRVSHAHGLAILRFRSPLLTESQLFSLPTGTEMFHFPAFPPAPAIYSAAGDTTSLVPGFPIRTSSDPRSVDSSPRHIAASHVLHRLPVPRHPPCALKHLQHKNQKMSQQKTLEIAHQTHKNTTPPHKGSRAATACLDARNHYPQIKHHTPPPKRGDNQPPPRGDPTRVTPPPVSHTRDEEIDGPVVSKPNSVSGDPSPARSLESRTGSTFVVHPNHTHYRCGPSNESPRITEPPHMWAGLSLVVLLRKEVIQPHLPVRLPCYDFVPIADPTFDGSLPHGVRPPASGVTDFHDVTGGVYKARERIHRSVADLRLLATPTSRGRVADPDPN